MDENIYEKGADFTAPSHIITKSLAEFAVRRRRSNVIIFPAACTSEKYFSAACVSAGRAQSAANSFGNKIVRFCASYFTSTPLSAKPFTITSRSGSTWR
ncbi:MAG: hypothetical protein IKB53_07455, partial [Oscillospiraceae bacterium]|nr:hypothetical protein [Oscillospiraceae bacterium]